ncbi:MAG: transcriptional repressor [Candidatus Marinimicrobia bacterium]|nr:transcriptional repressor [Candidatus Neomarinimicrobiota bacterium]|tara:strand:- start:16307 stop:16735 length:429 start_codon:yes stop_codon:yes gene_type:complete
MGIKKEIVDRFKNVLKKENLKFTNQRFLVFSALLTNEGHFDCDDLIRIINKKDGNVSRATAYRTLDLLVKYDFARKMVLDDGIAKYENKILSKHHDHMIDIETDEIIEFVNDEIERIQEEIAKSHGYKIVKHVHQLFVKKIK